MTEPAAARVCLVALVAAFVVVRAPVLGDYTWHHADEYLYTDAAVRMLDAGDLSTPRYADGTLRFNKPLLTYWVVAGSFATFGIGLAASRLPFLLAAALLAWVTWRCALRWLGEPATALLAVAILLAHPETAELATRATPDMLLCLFVAVCLHGITQLLLDDTPPPSAARWVWTGAGLAVATKGLPGLVALAYGGVALLATRGLRPLLAPGAMALGLALAAAGMVSAWARHGGTALLGLYADQVGARAIGGSTGRLLRNLGTQLTATVTELLPWSALVLTGGRASLDAVRRHAAPVAFGVGFATLLLALAALPEFTRPRYMAPANPVLAIACAAILGEVTRRSPLPANVSRLLLAAGTIVGLLLAAAGLRIGPVWVAVGLVVAGVGAAAGARARDGVAPLVALAAVMMIASGLLDAVVRPGVHVSPAPALAACLLDRGPAALPIATIGEVNTIPSDLRLASGGRLDVATIPDIPHLQADGRTWGTLIAPGGVAGRLEGLGWRLTPCGREVRRLGPADWWSLLRHGTLADLRIDQARQFFLASRP